jgi:hypothetical protein
MTGSALLGVAEILSTAIHAWHPIPVRTSGAICIAAFNAETS